MSNGRCLSVARILSILRGVDGRTTILGLPQWIKKGLRICFSSTIRVRFCKETRHGTYAGMARIGSGQSIAKWPELPQLKHG